MLNILSFPLYYISFSKKKNIEDHYKKYGFINVNHFQAIDGRKLNEAELVQNKIISVRSYDDLKINRVEHSGMPSKGAIGCSLSHYNLWKLCIDKNYPYIIIAEDDNRMMRKLTQKDLEKINETLIKPNSVFNSVDIVDDGERKKFFGTNFYIISKSACKKLIKDFFPIDVQVDWYLAHKASLGEVNLEGYKLSQQTTPFGKSSIQDICLSCFFPRNKWFYFCVILLGIVLVLGLVIYRKNWKTCLKTCSSSISSEN